MRCGTEPLYSPGRARTHRRKAMSNSLFLTSTDARSGKSAISLGLMEMLKRRIARVGFFRPIVTARHDHAEEDPDIQLISGYYNLDEEYDAMFGLTMAEAVSLSSQNREAEIIETILNKFHALAETHDFVLCEGTDFESASNSFEFDINAEVARNLGSPVLLTARAGDRSVEETLNATKLALDSLDEKGCHVIATIVNRVAEKDRWELLAKLRGMDVARSQLLYTIPEDKTLGAPTIREVARVLGARVLRGEGELDRHINGFAVAAMQLVNFLDRLEEGTLVIVPGDRADVIISCMAACTSASMKNPSGLLLSTGLEPDPIVWKLVEGLHIQLPILSVDDFTFEAASSVSNVKSKISPTNRRKISRAVGLFEQEVDIPKLEAAVIDSETTVVTPKMFEYELIRRARSDCQTIVLPEGEDERILRATEVLLRREVASLVLLGDPEQIQEHAARLGLNLERAELVNPADPELLEAFARKFLALRKHKGITLENARDAMSDVNYFATMMVHEGRADGMVSGAMHTTAATIRPGFEIIKTHPCAKLVSSVFFMCLADRVLVYGDCAINPDPDASQLAEIALSSARTADTFGVEPRVALLSYSSGESGKGEDVDKVREATRLAQERAADTWPDLLIEGPIQYDAAVDPGVAAKKMPESKVAGRATVLVFPDLNTGNNTYKAVQRSSGAVAVGPVLQGLNRPVNDLSRGCTVPDIVNTVAITAIQAQATKDTHPSTSAAEAPTQ